MRTPSPKTLQAASSIHGEAGVSRAWNKDPISCNDDQNQAADGVALGLTAKGLEAEVDALSALEAMLGGPRFWHPATLAQVAPAAVDSYLDRVAGGTPKQMERLAEARNWKITRPAWERVEAVSILLRHAPMHQRRALAFAAGIPLELVSGFKAEHDYLMPRDASLLWLPEGLSIPGGLGLSETAVSHIPKDLEVCGKLDIGFMTFESLGDGVRVRGDLYLGHARFPALPGGLHVGKNLWLSDTAISELPNDLGVEGILIIIKTPLAAKSDQEIRKMAPGAGKAGIVK